MNIDKEKLAALSSLCDADLWCEIRKIAKERGISLGDEVPSHEDMEKLRNVFLHTERVRISDAAAAIREYNRKYGK